MKPVCNRSLNRLKGANFLLNIWPLWCLATISCDCDRYFSVNTVFIGNGPGAILQHQALKQQSYSLFKR